MINPNAKNNEEFIPSVLLYIKRSHTTEKARGQDRQNKTERARQKEEEVKIERTRHKEPEDKTERAR